MSDETDNAVPNITPPEQRSYFTQYNLLSQNKPIPPRRIMLAIHAFVAWVM